MLFLKSLLRDAPKRHLWADDWPRPSSLNVDDADWTPEYDAIQPCHCGWHFFPLTSEAFGRWANWGEELWLVEIPEDALVRLAGDKIVASCARLVRQLASRNSILSPSFKMVDVSFSDDELDRLEDGFNWWASLFVRNELEPLRIAPYVVSDTMDALRRELVLA